MLAYYGTEISPNQTETAEGYLICRNVPIARTGKQPYLARELQLDGDPDRIIEVERREADVFEDAALASFEGKPVTDGHPPENVGPENFAAYARGHVQNVRREGGHIVADLYINDPILASEVRNRAKREVSCGYLCSYVPDGAGYRQTHIRGNHVAVVPRGRAGREVAIKDAAKAEKGSNVMPNFWKSVLTALGMAAKDASPEELDALVETTASVLDAVPAENAPEAEPMPESAPETEKPDSAMDALSEKLDKVLAALDSLQLKDPPLRDETALDSAIQHLSEGRPSGGGRGASDSSPAASITIAADESGETNSAAVKLLKNLRPAIAGITNRAERAKVVDALLGSLKTPDVMERINQAAASKAKKAADAKPDYQKICEAQQAEYYARNPHKKKED